MRTCFYLQPGKRKAKKMLHCWTVGALKENIVCVVDARVTHFRKGYTSVFYGVANSTVEVFNGAVQSEKPWLYIDNQYFSSHKNKNYRITWNNLQHTGVGKTDGRRLGKMLGSRGLVLGKWNTKGRHILVTLQSDLYFKLLMPYTRKQWLTAVLATLKEHTDRPIIVREKPHPSRPIVQKSFEQHLVDCYAIVTLNSATAIEGIMKGIPAFVTDPNCAIVPCAHTELSRIEAPEFFDREKWLQILADNQWAAKEIESGEAMRTLSKRKLSEVPVNLIQRTYQLRDIK